MAPSTGMKAHETCDMMMKGLFCYPLPSPAAILWFISYMLQSFIEQHTKSFTIKSETNNYKVKQ